MAEYAIGYTIRTKSGRGRITYRPDWSETLPWVSYYDGTAGKHFNNVISAQIYFQDRYRDPLNIPVK